MSIIPLHLQRRFEERWAARFGSPVIEATPKNVGLKSSPSTLRRARGEAKEKPAGVKPAGLMQLSALSRP
jgi:hypothetical protein